MKIQNPLIRFVLSPAAACALALLTLLVPRLASAGQGPGWQNPLNLPNEPGWGVADPQIICFRGVYYLYSTGDSNMRVWSSTDLVNWTDRGFCLTGAVNGKSWAPSILYYNGTFYLYAAGDLSSGAQNQAVYTSGSPLGPFSLAKTTLMSCIDGYAFMHNNNQLYFYYAASGGVKYRTMSDPLNANGGISQLTGCKVQVSSTWSERPHLFNLDGAFFIQYTGNEWTRDDYQTHMGRGSSPTSLSAQSTGNPILRGTTGTWRGAGCGSFVRDLDLKTLLSAYHVRSGSYRKLCIDRMTWNAQGNLVVDGPRIGQSLPGHYSAEFSDYFNRASIGGSYFNMWGGNWGLWNNELMWGDSRGQTGFKKELCSTWTAANYVVEVTTKLVNKGTTITYPKYGVVVSDNGNASSPTGFYVFIDDKSKVLAVNMRQNGSDLGWQNAALPNWDMTKWHNLRIQKNGDTFRIYFDGMLKMTKTQAGFGAGHIGMVTDDCHADFGWFAWSNW
jgi:hypothetical protein